jgi:hypothetical protein
MKIICETEESKVPQLIKTKLKEIENIFVFDDYKKKY